MTRWNMMSGTMTSGWVLALIWWLGGSQRVGFLTRGLMVVWVVKERAAQLKKLWPWQELISSDHGTCHWVSEKATMTNTDCPNGQRGAPLMKEMGRVVKFQREEPIHQSREKTSLQPGARLLLWQIDKFSPRSQGSVMIYLAELVEIYKPLLCNQHRFHLSGDHFKWTLNCLSLDLILSLMPPITLSKFCQCNHSNW